MAKAIKQCDMFATPETLQELQNWIDKHPADQRIHLTTAAYMMWNYLAKELCPDFQD
jgi:hypothetical protein